MPRRSVYPRRAAPPPATRVLEGFVRYDGAEPRLAISVPVAVVVAPSSASSRASLIVARAPRCVDGPTALLLLLLLLLRWEASCELFRCEGAGELFPTEGAGELFPTEGAGELELRWLGAAGEL